MKLRETKHYKDQMISRLARCGIVFSEVEHELNYVLGLVYEPGKSYAVKVKDIGKFVGESNKPYRAREESNGSVLWAIIRDCKLITFLLRRKNQPATPKALRTDVVIL